MTGSLAHLGGDRWRIRVSDGFRSGHRRQLSRVIRVDPPTPTGKPSRNTERAAAIALGELLEHTAHAADTLTVAGLVRRWLDHQHRVKEAAVTTRAYQARKVDDILAAFGTMHVGELRGHHINAWMAELAKGSRTRPPMSAASIHHRWRILRAVLHYGEKSGLVTGSPWKASSPPALKRRPPRMLTPEALLGVLATADGWLRVGGDLAARSGLRRGEMCGLRWSDLDGPVLHVQRSVAQVRGKLHVKDTKGGEDRRVTIDPATIAMLGVWRTRQVETARQTGTVLDGDWWMLADPIHDPTLVTPLRPDTFSQAWNRLCVREGVTCRLHDLRHWHATYCLANGVDLAALAARLGHKQQTTTLGFYSHALPAGDQQAADMMAAFGAESSAFR